MNEITKELLEACKAFTAIQHIDSAACGPLKSALLMAKKAIAKAEAALAAPQAAADGWIPWSGGECPLDLLTQVDVRYRNSGELIIGSTCLAGAYDWSHDERDYDIIAYRIVKESGK